MNKRVRVALMLDEAEGNARRHVRAAVSGLSPDEGTFIQELAMEVEDLDEWMRRCGVEPTIELRSKVMGFYRTELRKALVGLGFVRVTAVSPGKWNVATYRFERR